MAGISLNIKSIVLIIILIAGLGIGVYLVQTRQIFKSRASAQSVSVVNDSGVPVHVESDDTYSTTAESVTISIKDLDKLK